jgi:hypothetical protein
MLIPITVLLVAIVSLLWRHQSRRDFYVVQHLNYDLVFEGHQAAHGLRVTAKRGPLIGGFSESFSDFGAARAYFDHLEDPAGRPPEEVNHLYVVRGRKPPPTSSLTHPVTDDKPLLWVWIQSTPYSDLSARRREACEEYKALNYPDLP